MKLIERLFLKMQAFYGTKFNDLWHGIGADIVKETWAENLGGFTPYELGDALKTCLDERTMPPNLPQFIDLARRKPLQAYRARIDYKGCDKETALKNLAEIKRRFFTKEFA